MMKSTALYLILLLGIGLASCDSGPKVIESEPAANDGSAAASPHMSGVAESATDDHEVVAQEVLNTEKYTYIRVDENGSEFWIAVPKTSIEIGATYYYKGGLLKKNFPSREYNRVFETLYLVSGVTKQPQGSAVDQALSQMQQSGAVEPPKEIKPVAGAVKIADIIGNLNKYEGKQVKVTGKCMKINSMIMGRNWIHIQDGSANNFDLTVTTTENVMVGDIVTLEGTIAVNKDFGAGYKYNVIMEGAVRK